MEKRYGFVGITIENKDDHALQVQKILSEYSGIILEGWASPTWKKTGLPSLH